MAGLKLKLKLREKLMNSVTFSKPPHHVPKITGNNLHGVDHEGDWESHGHGSIKVWKYAAEDEVGTFKEKVHLDDESKTVTLVGIEGEHVFNKYKALTGIYQALPKDEGSFVRLAIEYEKRNWNIPAPTKYLAVMTNVAKDICAHLAKA